MTRELSLTRDVAGPFRTETGPCAADAELLGSVYGLPANLVEEVVAWWSAFQQRPVPTPPEWDYADREREDVLWRRVRAAAPSDVFVQPADFAPRPIRVRMFVDDVSGIGLWPNTVGWPPRPSFDEETLPIDNHLRARIRGWVDNYTASIGSDDRWRDGWGLEHDQRGHALSRELQAQLGPDYRVEFSTSSREGRLAGLSDAHPSDLKQR